MKRTLTTMALATSLCTALQGPVAATPMPSVAAGEASTREAALSSALRHAVEQVVGMSIGTSTSVQNLRNIQDQVYTSATGYIEKYDVIDEVRLPGGGYRVTVNAVVTKEKLTAAVSKATAGGVSFDGAAAFANAQLALETQKDYERRMKALLDELCVDGIKYSFTPRVVADESKPGYSLVHLDGFKAELDPAWYARYRDFYNDLITKPFFGTVLTKGYRYVIKYGGSADPYLDVNFLDSSGEKLVQSGLPLRVSSTSVFRDGTGNFLFSQSPLRQTLIDTDCGFRHWNSNGVVAVPISNKAVELSRRVTANLRFTEKFGDN